VLELGDHDALNGIVLVVPMNGIDLLVHLRLIGNCGSLMNDVLGVILYGSNMN